MPSPPRPPERTTDLVLLGFGAAVLLMGSQVRELWARDDAPWWLPFVTWSVVLLIAGLLGRAWSRHGD